MNVTVAAAQYPITEHQNFDDWRLHVERWVADAARQHAQILVFPEYGSMELVSIFPPEVKANIRQQVHELEQWAPHFCSVYADLAKKYGVVIVAPSLPVIENGKNLNRAYVFSGNGLAGYQDKLFMTRFEDEEWGIQSGAKTLTLFEAPWGAFGIQICYDVEFPLGAQVLSGAGASLILAPSCTESIRGSTRVHIGARARALENQVFTVVSPTIGNAPWSPAVDINYGAAAFYCTPDVGMPEEGVIKTMMPQAEGWLLQSLDLAHINAVRHEGQVFNFKDSQRLQSTFPAESINIVRKSI